MTKWTEERRLAWKKQCQETGCNKRKKPMTVEESEKNRLRSIEANKNYWTDERRKEQSDRMKRIVEQNPDSYSKHNVSGRVKLYEVTDSFGTTKVKGTWELQVANYLNRNNIKWTNNIEPFKYFWNKKWHLYFPDFLLLDSDILIEVKGYETERDREKWKSVDKELIVLRKRDMITLNESLSRVIVLGN